MKAILLRAMFAGIIIIVSVACVFVIRPDLFRGETARIIEEAVPASESIDPIAQFRAERQQLRSLQLSELDKMINSESASEETRKLAEEEKFSILSRTETEETIGSILRARGFEGAAACSEDSLITVMIYSAQPTEAEIAVIMDAIASQTKINPQDIKIIPIN